MAAWQDTIVPPAARVQVDPTIKDLGRQVFEKAGCAGCHAGPFLTNHTVIPSGEIAANPVRAMALEKTEKNLTEPVIYSFDTPVPLPKDPQRLSVPTGGFDPGQIDLAWAHHGSAGGYKVPALVGLYWSAPYLHDGGVAAGTNETSDLGIPGTVEKNKMPDAANSLKSVDRSRPTRSCSRGQ